MVEYPSSGSVTWVSKRNGQLVPFEADRISRDLFAATERMRHPDAFLARELTDSILHFLAMEAEGTTPTTTQVAELVVKVLRELGHPALADAFAQYCADSAPDEKGQDERVPAAMAAEVARWVEEAPPAPELSWRLSRACLAEYSLQHVFERDILAAHAGGLLALGNLETPLELAGCVLGPLSTVAPGALLESIRDARSVAGDFLAIDGPEHALLHALDPGAAAEYVRELRLGLEANGLRAVVNLNAAVPPDWAADLAQGPLFAGPQGPSHTQKAQVVDALLDHLLASGTTDGSLRIDWHLGERDFLPEKKSRLLRLARLACEGPRKRCQEPFSSSIGRAAHCRWRKASTGSIPPR